MPLNVEISLINAIDGESFDFDEIPSENLQWTLKPPKTLEPFKFSRCYCYGPSSGYEIPLKFGGLICRVKITSWGVSFKTSTPSHYNIETVLIQDTPPYRVELILV